MFLPLLVSLLIVFGSPYVGQARGAFQSAFPEYYRWTIGGIVTVAAVMAVAAAVVRLRGFQRDSSKTEASAGLPIRVRYALIATAVAVGATYARGVRTGDPEVDMVEAFHFVEYGLVAYVWYRPWRSRPDLPGALLAACAAMAVGVADEWVQWFVPARVGELHDVGLNGVAVGCGVLISMAVHPPLALAFPRRRQSRIALGTAVSLLIIAVAGFVDLVHLGHEVRDGQSGVFQSRYDARALADAAATRAARWEASPPPVHGFTREDHYLSEGEWHVARRNTAVGTGDWRAAWGENAILERFYTPVLDRLGRWSIEQRAEIEQSARRSARGAYVSDAVPVPIYPVRRSTFWVITILVSGALFWVCARPGSTFDHVRV